MECSSLILPVKEAAMLAPIAELKKAASSALLISKATQAVKENKDAYERLGYDSSRLIVTIWRSFKEAKDPVEWLSADMQDILEDLSHTLENICSFVNKRLSTSKAILSRADGLKIHDYLAHLKYVMQTFELQSQMSMNDGLIQIPQENDQTLHRNEEEVEHALEMKTRDARGQEIAEKFQEERELEQKRVEINRQIEDGRWHSDELKKIAKEEKSGKSDLKRLRLAVEEAKRLKKAEEEEIAQLKQALSAAKEDNRQKVDEGEVEVVDSEESASEEEEERPARMSSKVKKIVSEDEEEDLQSLHAMSMRNADARRKLSSASLRRPATEDDYTDTDEEDDYVPPRRTSSGTRYRSVDDLVAQFQRFRVTPMGLGTNARSGSSIYMPGVYSNPYFPTSFSSPMGPYGNGVGTSTPGLIVNAGVGNINNTHQQNTFLFLIT